MSSLRVVARVGILGFLVLESGTGCARLRSTDVAPSDRLSDSERVAHVLSRLTYGARPGDAERVAAIGVERWIDQQLHPETIPDSALTLALAANPAWSVPASTVGHMPPIPRNVAQMSVATAKTDSAARAALTAVKARLLLTQSATGNLIAGKLASAQVSDRQLLEVLTDFWENHFSVYSGKMPSLEALPVWDREVLRPRAMGKFRDLLGATAHSAAMLYYLDNHLSRKGALNENYARELMELHTLGVDGGYTQQDVIEVARALTGWTIRRGPDSTGFAFQRAQHDTGEKHVLGHVLARGRGIEDGEEVLDILARHPATAHHIALKLARRFVSDDPPPALVDRAAATFLRTDGDIREVVRTIITSREFFSRAAFRVKVKTPFEYVVSVARALNAPADSTERTSNAVAQLGQRPFGWSTPEGFPERGSAWINSGMLYGRIKFAGNVADGRVAYLRVEQWRDWAPLSSAPLDAQVAGIARDFFGGSIDEATRQAMLSVAGADGTRRLRDLITIAIASPDFQRR